MWYGAHVAGPASSVILTLSSIPHLWHGSRLGKPRPELHAPLTNPGTPHMVTSAGIVQRRYHEATCARRVIHKTDADCTLHAAVREVREKWCSHVDHGRRRWSPSTMLMEAMDLAHARSMTHAVSTRHSHSLSSSLLPSAVFADLHPAMSAHGQVDEIVSLTTGRDANDVWQRV